MALKHIGKINVLNKQYIISSYKGVKFSSLVYTAIC